MKKILSSLTRVFNREPAVLSTTPTPTGTVNHSRYGERPWDYNDYHWSTYNHPVRFEMHENDYGSHDIVQRMNTKGWKWSNQSLRTHLSKQEALNILIDKEVSVMRDYRGFKSGLSLQQLNEHLAQTRYPRNHVFGYVQKHPEVLEAWLNSRFPQVEQTARAAAPAAPKAA